MTRAPTKELPPLDYLRECFDLDEETGTLRWRIRPREHFKTARTWRAWNTLFAGKVTGATCSDGYLQTRLCSRIYKVHRVVYALVHGGDCPPMIDHIDGDKKNNRPVNLRPATTKENGCNRKPTNGVPVPINGVRLVREGVFRVAVMRDGVYHNGGRFFYTLEEAIAARDALAIKLDGEFFRPSIESPAPHKKKVA
jgi:HNH endonuclease